MDLSLKEKSCKTNLTISKGKTFTLKYTITKDTYTTVKYSTGNKNVATVSSKGVIKQCKREQQ